MTARRVTHVSAAGRRCRRDKSWAAACNSSDRPATVDLANALISKIHEQNRPVSCNPNTGRQRKLRKGRGHTVPGKSFNACATNRRDKTQAGVDFSDSMVTCICNIKRCPICCCRHAVRRKKTCYCYWSIGKTYWRFDHNSAWSFDNQCLQSGDHRNLSSRSIDTQNAIRLSLRYNHVAIRRECDVTRIL